MFALLAAASVLSSSAEHSPSDHDCPASPPPPPPLLSRWPEERASSVCGDGWQQRYRDLHHAAVRAAASSSSPSSSQPSIVVFEAVEMSSGYADRLTGLLTALLLGVLTDRAIAIRWSGHEAALGSDSLDLKALLPSAIGGIRSGDSHTLDWNNANRIQVHEQLKAAPYLAQLWPKRVLVVRSNRGMTQGLLATFAEEAAARGLNASNAQFGCLFNFLLRPTPEALAPLAGLRREMDSARTSGVPIVGVHVRSGDASFGTETGAGEATNRARGETLYREYRFIFDFADSLPLHSRGASPLATPEGEGGPATAQGPAPLVLLLGDSVALRMHMSSLLGPRLLSSNLSVAHVGKGGAGDAAALRNAVAEHWIFGGADSFVYSSHSGFPRTAAARAMRDDAIHTCFHYQGKTFGELQQGRPRPKRECTGPWSVAELGDRHAAGL